MSALKKGLKVSPTVASSFCIRKKKELAMRPVLPDTFHSMDAVRENTHYPSDPSKARRLPDRLFPQTLEEANAGHCETPFHQALGPRLPLRVFHTHQGFVQRNNWIFEVLFPKCQSCLVSSSDVVFPRGVAAFFSCILWLPSISRGFLLSGPPVAFSFPQPCSFLCRPHTFLPSLLLRCPCIMPDRRRTSRCQPRRDPILLLLQCTHFLS